MSGCVRLTCQRWGFFYAPAVDCCASGATSINTSELPFTILLENMTLEELKRLGKQQLEIKLDMLETLLSLPTREKRF